MKTKFCKTALLLVLAFAAGAGVMRWWDTRPAVQSRQLAALGEDSTSVWLLNMQQATVPQGVQEIKTDDGVVQEVTIPSQLSKLERPDIQTIIGRSGAVFAPDGEDTSQPETDAVVDLQNVSYKTLPSAGGDEPETESKISMIEAPVNAKIINALEEYREFKRQARGNYPSVDFKKQQIIVLESASNLPDKAFEIVSVNPGNGKRVVTYRINVFGLDKKTNTHSVIAVEKTDLPLELKQVL